MEQVPGVQVLRLVEQVEVQDKALGGGKAPDEVEVGPLEEGQVRVQVEVQGRAPEEIPVEMPAKGLAEVLVGVSGVADKYLAR